MTAAAIDEWHAAAERVRDNRPDIGVHIVNYGALKDGVSVEVTELALNACAGCDQPISTGTPGPVDAIDQRTGKVDGGWSHQHGCGEWNSPHSVRRAFDLEDDLDPDNERSVSEVLDETLAAMVAEVDTKVAEEREGIRRGKVKDLKAAVREAIRLLEEGVPEDEVLAPLHDDEGVSREGGVLVAWAPLPWDCDSDGVVVTEADLREVEQ